VLRTVYGKVIVKSPRLWSCACEQTAQTPRRVVHPLSKTLTRRVTPELEYLQAKWAAHLPYRQATTMLKEVLPLNKGISFSGARNRIHTLGKLLDADIERDISKLPRADFPIVAHQYLDRKLVRWAQRKYKTLRRHKRRSEEWLHKMTQAYPRQFAHWQYVGVQVG
jgi:hypothetical protein